MEAKSDNIEEELEVLVEDNKKKQQIVADLENEGKDLSSKILEIEWNIKKIEFAKFYENKEINEERDKMKTIEARIKAAEEKWTSLEIPYNETKAQLNIVLTTLSDIKSQFVQLQEQEDNNKKQVVELQRNVQVLKNRNSAMMLKLKKQLEELEFHISSFTNQMSVSNELTC